MTGQSQDQSPGWASCCLKGCIGLIIFTLVAAFLIYHGTIYLARTAAAAGIEALLKTAARELKFPEEDIARMMKPIASFTRQIRDGKIGVDDAANVGQALVYSPILPSLIVAAFENNQIKSSELSPQQKQDAHVTITRFMQGMLDGKIASDQVDLALAPIKESYERHGRQEKRIKAHPSPEELLKSLETMTQAADQAKIVETTRNIDLPEEIDKAIKKGLAKK